MEFLPFSDAVLEAAQISAFGDVADQPCPTLQPRRRPSGFSATTTLCACPLRCPSTTHGGCDAIVQKCGNLSWCTHVSLNEEGTWATLKANGRRFGVAADALAAAKASWISRASVAMLLGEQKCATTAVDAHIRPSFVRRFAPKERHIFDMTDYVTSCQLSNYLGKNSPDGTSTLLDATPDYLQNPIAAANVHAIAPHTKLVVLVRNPIDRAYAAWKQVTRAGWEVRPFRVAVQDELPQFETCISIANEFERIGRNYSLEANASWARSAIRYVNECIGKGCWLKPNVTGSATPACKHYLLKGLFMHHIGLWLRFFPPAQMAIVNADHVFIAPATISSRILQWMNLRPLSGPIGILAGGSGRGGCWHNCDAKSPISSSARFQTSVLGEDLTRRLELLYKPFQDRLSRLQLASNQTGNAAPHFIGFEREPPPADPPRLSTIRSRARANEIRAPFVRSPTRSSRSRSTPPRLGFQRSVFAKMFRRGPNPARQPLEAGSNSSMPPHPALV